MNFFKKSKPEDKQAARLADVRDAYDPSYFDGRGLLDYNMAEGTVLVNLLIQGEVTRLAITDLLAETREMHKTQRALLEEMRAARLGNVA